MKEVVKIRTREVKGWLPASLGRYVDELAQTTVEMKNPETTILIAMLHGLAFGVKHPVLANVCLMTAEYDLDMLKRAVEELNCQMEREATT